MTKLTYSAYWLHDSDYADCYSPDSNDSEGAKFLLGVQDDVNEIDEPALKADIYDEQASEWAHEIADSAVPIYTYPMWQTFVDLGAFNEDPEDLGSVEDADMSALAGRCLYMIAYRLAVVLIEERKKELGVGGIDTEEEA